MGLWNRVDIFDRVAQSMWFWVGTVFVALTGGLVMLGRATEIFMSWAPLSYGLVAALSLPLALWCAVPLRRLIPKSESRMVRLGRRAQHHADNIISTLRTSDMFGINPQTYYQAVTFMVDLEKDGFDVPELGPKADVKVSLDILGHYLSIIAPLLVAGHTGEAKRAAQQICANPPRELT